MLIPTSATVATQLAARLRRSEPKPAARWRILGGRLSTRFIALLMAAAVLPWLAYPMTSVEASHPNPVSDGYGRHIYGVHFASDAHGVFDEDYCAQSYTSSISTTDLYSKLLSTIYSAGWDGTGAGNIDNWPLPYSCESYTGDTSWIEYRISVIDDASAYTCGTTSCVQFYYPLYQNGVIKHHWQGGVWLKTFHINPLTSDSATATINHELGHVYGLADGGGAQCGLSIMHQFDYCPPLQPTYVQWPLAVDINSVTSNVMPNH